MFVSRDEALDSFARNHEECLRNASCPIKVLDRCGRTESRGRVSGRAVRCERVETGAERVAVVKNGSDSLEICEFERDVATSGGWGRMDRVKAVDAMLSYADSGKGRERKRDVREEEGV
ncbi:hypothetical protein Syun_022420 [Stephania yunnanensis]|uniref:Uncharacterized protein n=1 Tax=Stephania yunnanensis TaxID=152371 RepID=A0AAP0I365_9MAGN